MRERTERKKQGIYGCDAESVHVVGLKSCFGRVLVGKEGCRDEVVEECFAKIFEALVRRSVGDGEM